MYTAPGFKLPRGGSGSRWGRSTRRRSPKGFARAVAERDAARRPFGPLGDLKFGREPVCQPAFLVTATAAYGAFRSLPRVLTKGTYSNLKRTPALGVETARHQRKQFL